MNCPTCGYDFDPTAGLTCPRCNEPLDCGSIDCGECGACSSVFAGVRNLFRSQREEGSMNTEGDDPSDSPAIDADDGERTETGY